MVERLRQLFRGEATSTALQLFRYTVVGGLAFTVDFAILWLLTDFLHVHYLASAALAFLTGLVVNYCLSIIWVFNQRVVNNRWAEFTAFGVLGIAGLGLNEISMYLFTGILGLHYLGSKIISTVLTYAWNFVSRKLLLFTKTSSPGAGSPSACHHAQWDLQAPMQRDSARVGV
jgi:putative flippase GtrA